MAPFFFSAGQLHIVRARPNNIPHMANEEYAQQQKNWSYFLKKTINDAESFSEQNL